MSNLKKMAVINLIRKKGINPQTKTTLYFPQWTRRSTDTAMELAEEMDGSTYSQGEITGMLVDFPKRVLRSLLNGNAAKIPGLGTFKLKVTGAAKEKIEDVTTQGCKAQIVFDVDATLAAKLAGAKFTFVTKPTVEGEQDANEEVTPTTEGTETTGGETTGDNTGTVTPSNGDNTGNTGGNTGGDNDEPGGDDH